MRNPVRSPIRMRSPRTEPPRHPEPVKRAPSRSETKAPPARMPRRRSKTPTQAKAKGRTDSNRLSPTRGSKPLAKRVARIGSPRPSPMRAASRTPVTSRIREPRSRRSRRKKEPPRKGPNQRRPHRRAKRDRAPRPDPSKRRIESRKARTARRAVTRSGMASRRKLRKKVPANPGPSRRLANPRAKRSRGPARKTLLSRTPSNRREIHRPVRSKSVALRDSNRKKARSKALPRSADPRTNPTPTTAVPRNPSSRRRTRIPRPRGPRGQTRRKRKIRPVPDPGKRINGNLPSRTVLVRHRREKRPKRRLLGYPRHSRAVRRKPGRMPGNDSRNSASRPKIQPHARPRPTLWRNRTERAPASRSKKTVGPSLLPAPSAQKPKPVEKMAKLAPVPKRGNKAIKTRRYKKAKTAPANRIRPRANAKVGIGRIPKGSPSQHLVSAMTRHPRPRSLVAAADRAGGAVRNPRPRIQNLTLPATIGPIGSRILLNRPHLRTPPSRSGLARCSWTTSRNGSTRTSSI